MAEALNGTFKTDLVGLHGPWRTRRQLELAIIEWIDRDSHRQLHRILYGALSRTQQHWHRQHQLVAATSNP